MQTNLRKHQTDGPVVIARGEGCRVFDDAGREYIDTVAGLWCASLGFGSERLARVAAHQMRTLGYYHLYRHRSSVPAITPGRIWPRRPEIPPAAASASRVATAASFSRSARPPPRPAWRRWARTTSSSTPT